MNDDIEHALRRELHAQLVPYDDGRVAGMIDVATRVDPTTRRYPHAPLAAVGAVLVLGVAVTAFAAVPGDSERAPGSVAPGGSSQAPAGSPTAVDPTHWGRPVVLCDGADLSTCVTPATLPKVRCQSRKGQTVRNLVRAGRIKVSDGPGGTSSPDVELIVICPVPAGSEPAFPTK